MPNIDWDGIKLEGVFEADISKWTCEEEDDCVTRHLQQIFIPEFLFAEIEQQVLATMMNTMKVPSDDSDDKRNILR